MFRYKYIGINFYYSFNTDAMYYNSVVTEDCSSELKIKIFILFFLFISLY